MEALGILRAVALFCFLVLGFHSPAVNAGQDSTDAEPITRSATFTEPSTLKDTLDLLGKISASKMKAQVLQKVEDRIKAYLKTDGIPGETAEKIFDAVLKSMVVLRRSLLYDRSKYGKYMELPESDIDFAADALVKYLPILHSELLFLYFQVGEESITIGGSSWKTHPVGESYYTAQLHRWLTDKLDKKDVPYIPKGFKADGLRDSNRGNDIAPFMGISLSDGAVLSYAQYGLFLLSPTWHPSNLASALLFVQEFCSEVNKEAGIFKEASSDTKYNGLKSVCKATPKVIRFLTKHLQPLYDNSTTMYKGHLMPEAFLSYVDWLGKNLSGMSESLEQMLSESSEWTYDSIYKADSAGPFKYGFDFKDDKWTAESDDIQSGLRPAIDKLTRSESESLRALLNEIPKAS